MPISSLLSFKLIFISTSLLSAAVALKLSAPAITDFAVTEVPTIYNGVVSWLRPPYLYLVINCIIITIVASSKFQSKLEYPMPPPPLVPVAVAPPNGIVFHAPPQAVQQIVPPREFFGDGRNVFAEAVGIPVAAPPPGSVNFSFTDVNHFEDVKSKPEPVEYEYGENFNGLNRFEAVKSSPEPVDFEYGDSFNGLSRFEAVKSSPEPVDFEYGDSFNGLSRFEAVKSSPEPVDFEYGDSFNGLNRFEAVKSSPEPVDFEYGESYNGLNRFEDVKSSPEEEIGTVSADINATVEAIPPEMEIDVDEFSVSKSEWSPPVFSRVKEPSEIPVYSQKPPVASRFGHRRSIKASSEGGKAVLGVSRSKKQDTLETTWKTITEGRAMPLTRHLRKSDTWEREGHHGGRQQQQQEQRMTKSETFNDVSGGTAAGKSLQRAAGGSGKLKREASPGQDELNRRVEAFIKKFNEDMRLQRQESLNQYREMISRGAH